MFKYSEYLTMNIFTVVLSKIQFPWTKVKYLRKSAKTIMDCCMMMEDPSHLAATV